MRYIVRKCDDGDTITRSGKTYPWSWDVVEIEDGTERVVANFNTRAAARSERAARLQEEEKA
jgi:hypothetical protein